MNPLFAGKFAGAFQPTAAPSGFDFEALISKAPKDQQDRLRTRLLESQIEAESTRQALAPLAQQYTLDELGRFREQEAIRAQKLGKESVETAAKYSMLTGLPKTIAQGFGNIAATNLYAGQAVADTFAKTLAYYPKPQFASYQFQPEKYFG